MRCVPGPLGDIWLIRGKERLRVSTSFNACVFLHILLSHFSSASCSAGPLIPFSSRPKHPRYIIIILLTVVLLWKGSTNREQISGQQYWRKCLRALMTQEQLLVGKRLNLNTFFDPVFLSDARCSERCLQQQYATIWDNNSLFFHKQHLDSFPENTSCANNFENIYFCCSFKGTVKHFGKCVLFFFLLSCRVLHDKINTALTSLC